MHWGTFKYFLMQVTKILLKISFAFKSFFWEKKMHSFFRVIPLAPSYKF